MGKRYFTYTDYNSVNGRFLGDFGISYHVDEVGLFDQLKLQFNIYNIAGTKYWSTIGTNGFVASDPTSINNNTLQQGAPHAITGTFSVKFQMLWKVHSAMKNSGLRRSFHLQQKSESAIIIRISALYL